MSTLHTVNKSPFNHATLSQCARLCHDQDAIVLLEDGVYGALTSSPCATDLASLLARGVALFALECDLRARGLEARLLPGIQVTDERGFVRLSLEHKTLQSWY
ncbi:sulfurtransferase complex subunit TusB [Marinimicrobium alkaliphilum]|uniref:sulfurtransferase complex subunit TusB n=1 Tax=Marinimicrobium alkaliphilum TaxID=2202654 RepID=UPI000DBA0B90|nr:sulfurtransferase complex subunit TusB [Marinimicrobium alkaliphilum]